MFRRNSDREGDAGPELWLSSADPASLCDFPPSSPRLCQRMRLRRERRRRLGLALALEGRAGSLRFGSNVDVSGVPIVPLQLESAGPGWGVLRHIMFDTSCRNDKDKLTKPPDCSRLIYIPGKYPHINDNPVGFENK